MEKLNAQAAANEARRYFFICVFIMAIWTPLLLIEDVLPLWTAEPRAFEGEYVTLHWRRTGAEKLIFMDQYSRTESIFFAAGASHRIHKALVAHRGQPLLISYVRSPIGKDRLISEVKTTSGEVLIHTKWLRNRAVTDLVDWALFLTLTSICGVIWWFFRGK